MGRLRRISSVELPARRALHTANSTMQIVTVDFETYFDKEFTLSKMTTEAYIRDPRFEILGCGVRWPDGRLEWMASPPDLNRYAVLCHHAQFDGLILSHVYGVRPHVWLDTLSMARLVIGNHLSLGLDHLAKHFGLAGKTIDYASFRGKRWNDLGPSAQRALARGCLHDVELTWQIFNLLAKDFPTEEYPIVDTTVRMFTEPVLIGDQHVLADVWTTEARKKRDLLAQLGLTAQDVQSSARFVQLLADEGVDVPSKDGTNGAIPCIAKTDAFMKALQEDENETVRALAAARLGVRSTIEQTRAERLGFAAGRGALPVYLRYAGAHTTRWAGGDRVNWQNFPRQSGIRKAIRAPVGYKIVKADKAQIECRLLNCVAGQHDVIERFRNHEDPYTAIAALAYYEHVYKPAKDDPRRVEMETKRGTGKQLELSCGYGAGAETIVRTAARGTYGPPVKIDIDTGLRWRDLYRNSHTGVVALWRQAGRIIARLAGGEPIKWNVVEIKDGKIVLPNGSQLKYPELSFADDNWQYRSRYGRVKLYGAKLVENLIQALSRVDMSQTLLRLRDYGLRPVTMEHDSAAFVILDKDVEQAQELIRTEFCRPPSWLPDLPLDCDVTVGETYA